MKLEKWLEVHPDLKTVLPFKCSTCGSELPAKPYSTLEWVGVQSDACACGDQGQVACYPRSEKRRKEATEAFRRLAEGVCVNDSTTENR